jgi:hypothetical protein
MQTLGRKLPPINARSLSPGSVQPKAVQVAYLFGVHRVRLCSRVRSLHKTISLHLLPLRGEILDPDTPPPIVLNFNSSTRVRLHRMVSITFPPTSSPSLTQARASTAYPATSWPTRSVLPSHTPRSLHISLSPLHLSPTSHLV